ncbi:MAG: DMT family transporter [Flavobacteriales bacterium]|nr:DMT family transporter [Flavobacteriales bacterium]
MRAHSRAHVALFIVNLIYGLNYVVAKGLMPSVIGPSGFILLRVLGALVLFVLLFAWRPQRIAWPDLARLGLCALFGVALNQLMFFHGLMRTAPTNASLIMVATPILVLVFAAALIGERIRPGKVVGILLGAAGALLLVFLKPSATASGATLLGDAFILVNASSYAIYLVLVKPLMAKYSAATVMTGCFAIGAALVLPFGIGEFLAVDWAGLSRPNAMAMAFVVVMVTFVAYLLNTWALGVVSPSVVGAYVYMQPVLATGAAWLALRIGPSRLGLPAVLPAELGWEHGLCAMLIFSGVHLVNRSDRER